MPTVSRPTRIEVVLPAHNEAASIGQTVREFYHVAHDIQRFPIAFVICEDGSSDSTREVAVALASEVPVQVLSSVERKGYTRAVAEGLRSTTSDVIAFVDGDGQCDPSDFGRLYDALDSHDIVIGRRTPRTDGWARRLMSRAFGIVYRSLFSVPVKDPSCPFLIMRREAIAPVLIESFGLLSQGFWWEFMARASAAGLSVREVPVCHRPRAAGKTQNFRAWRIPRIAIENLHGLMLLHKELLPAVSTASGIRWVRPEHLSTVAPADVSPIDAGGPDRRSLRILEIATEAPPCRGGISRVLGYLAEGLTKHGHVVDVIAYPGLPRLRFGEIRLSSMCLKAWGLHRRLNDYDVVHIHGATPTLSDVALIVAATTHPRPLVVYTHHADLDLGTVKWPSQLYNRLHTRLTRIADVTACSTPTAARALSHGGSNFVIPLGVDLRQFTSERDKPDTFTVLYVGQFRPWKSVPVLLHAVARVPGMKLIIAGTGAEENNYRRIAAQLGLDPEFHIGVDDDTLRRLYERAHAIVVPSTSRMEAFGLALIEGMAAGCIPIASDLPGVRDAVGALGFTFPAGDVDALVVILEKLRDDPGLVSEMGSEAREGAAEFSRERMVASYEYLLLDLARTRAYRGPTRLGPPITGAKSAHVSHALRTGASE
jgi:rhamnosyl/mannosyltransferase